MFPWKKKTEERAVEVSEKNGDELISAVFNSDKVSKEMALQIPAISGSIDLIGGVVASTPIRLYKRIGNTIEEITNDNRIRLLNSETGDTLDSNQFWKAVVRDYYTGKGGYIYINKYRNHVKSLHYVDESKISIVDRDNPIFKDYDIYVNGQRYWDFDFIKILRNTKDGAKGSSIIDENSMLILVSYQSLKLELNASKRGGTKKGFLKSDRKIEEGAIAKLKAGFRRMFSDDSENFIVLNGGIDFKETSNTLAEMQLNENKQTNANEIAKIFHVSQELVSGNESDTTALAKLAAIPLMSAIESALNKDLLLEKEKGEYYFAFDTKELLKGDLTERFNAYKTALDANFMQIDEVRSKENLPELGLDFLKLGLQDVLYNPKTKEVFTPNTGKSQKIDESSLKEVLGNDILEERGNPNHDPKTGRFSSSKTKTKYAPTKSSRPRKGVKMSYKKYTALCGKIATNHPEWKDGTHIFNDSNYAYTLKVIDYGDYEFIRRYKIK